MIYFGFIFIFFIRKHCILLQTVLRRDGGSYQKKLLKLVVCGFYWQLWRKAAAWKHCQPGQHAGMCKCCLGERDKAPCGTGLWLPFAVDFIWFCVLYLSVNNCQSIFEACRGMFLFSPAADCSAGVGICYDMWASRMAVMKNQWGQTLLSFPGATWL